MYAFIYRIDSILPNGLYRLHTLNGELENSFFKQVKRLDDGSVTGMFAYKLNPMYVSQYGEGMPGPEDA
jgi:hypothetical protein